MNQADKITIKGARVHNLKNINIEIPKNKFVVLTGVSGSGKSSLAFDTIYAEGQRRYAESLSSYARQFLGMMDKPDVDRIDGLSPTIAIDQRTLAANPRSTVGTVTEIYDYLRLLFTKIGRVHCPKCGREIFELSPGLIAEQIAETFPQTQINILAPLYFNNNIEFKQILEKLQKADYKEIRFDGFFKNLLEAKYLIFAKDEKHSAEVLIDKLKTNEKIRLTKAIETALDLGRGMILASEPTKKEERSWSQFFGCPKCGISLPKIELRSFSFNSPYGACPECTGLGVKSEIDPALVIPNPRLTLAEGAIKPWSRIAAGGSSQLKSLEQVAGKYGFSIDIPVKDLTQEQLNIVLYGESTKSETSTTNSNLKSEILNLKYDGVIPNLEKKYKETDSDYIRKEIENYMRTKICPACGGKRLKKEILAVTVLGFSIADVSAFSIDRAYQFFSALNQNNPHKLANQNSFKIRDSKNLLSLRDQKIAESIIKEILNRLSYLQNVGLNYLTLDRAMTTLSGGEAQRLRLATQIGSSLTGVIYILDEPSIGLHAKDNTKLINTLKKLRDEHNTVIVVEHDQATMEASDYLIDIGPGAGEYGGQIVTAGTFSQIKQNKKSLTGSYLNKKSKIEIPKTYRKGNGKYISIKGATEFNLKDINVKIPLGKFVCVTGVSGSGKSTLITEILSKALSQKLYHAKDLPGKHKEIKGIENVDKVITIDQSPIGRTPRSNPATYTGVFTYIRDLFTEIPEAKTKGYDAGKFSFNVKGGGRCETCAGEGAVKIEMQFLPDVYVECEACHGRRYNTEALEINYKGKNIADILNMTVIEAKQFFSNLKESPILEKLQILEDVGLGYLHLGQSATTLSGGEAQRIKLATELSRRATGRTLYILDEPTTGLHFDDIKKLLIVLNQLVDKGNTVLIIEHNLDIIKCADWIIDLGPEGGEAGGYLVAEGTPKDIIKAKKSYTGQYLKKLKIGM
jgi:excinuclease ABC subunit A